MESPKLLRRRTSSDGYDALELLKQDHAAVAELFDHYEGLDNEKDKQALACRILRALTVHIRVEEGLFYPALRKALGDQAAMEEADVDHAMIKMLMADLNGTSADAAQLDAKVSCLAHLVESHAKMEEGRIFEAARATNLNLMTIGGQLDAYRAALESRYELDRDGTELAAFLSTATAASVAMPAPAPHKPRRPARADHTFAQASDGKPGRSIKAIAPSRRRRQRGSSGGGTEATEGEST